MTKEMMKDEKLSDIIEKNYGNIAQFISFDLENEEPRYVYIKKYSPGYNCGKRELVEQLIDSAPSKSINIRSYSKKVMKGNELVFNKKIEDIDEILDILSSNKANQKYSIINENIDISDGGVSGVVLGDVIEFAPQDTPKCVDKVGVCSLPKDIGLNMLEKVYGFRPEINFGKNYRVEFSIHPSRQGVLEEHTIIWEYEYYDNISKGCNITWPNNFSKFLGDKAFGLLIADVLGLKVPRTIVISRWLAPFTFGISTGLHEKWIRTCPVVKEPGKYYTGDKWVDPFEMMIKEEKKGEKDINIASILSQEAVEPIFSGACIVKERMENDIIEGVSGKGDLFMLGEEEIDNLPKEVIRSIKRLNNKIRRYFNLLGEVSIEWVYDGNAIWVVQLNQIRLSGNKDIIVEGNPKEYIKFDTTTGLEKLRELIKEIKTKDIGIELLGNIGITSHFGDLLRLANIPSYLKR
ncbi:hypothetical protein ACR77J_19050 [Tissierella praeacuta]|uniref:hypothetical protein n=1 Tax=Tissierella praeacuta TaxID=43131 RepID=UPI003DA58DFF